MFNFSNNDDVTVAIYCRVSSEDQSDRGTIKNQVDYAENYCSLNGFKVYDFYLDDGVSGVIPFVNRPAAMNLLKDAMDNKFNTVIFYKLDRLGRNTKVIIDAIHLLENLNIKLKSMTEPFDTKDPSGRFLLTILAGVADLERSNILERSRIGMERKAASGKWLGGTPCLGYYVNDDKELAINDVINEDLGYSEAEVVRLVFSEFLRDGATTLTVASKFNSNNVPNSYCFRPNTVKSHSGLAKYWKYTTILNVLNNRAYIGEFQYGKRGKNPISYTIPAIITKEQFYMAQDKLKRNKLFSSRNRKHTYLLTGKIYCGCCGSRYTSYKKHYYNGKNIEYYRCYRNSNFIKELRCNNANINGNNLENTIWNICLNILNDFDENKLPFQKQNNNSSNKQELIKEKISSVNYPHLRSGSFLGTKHT